MHVPTYEYRCKACGQELEVVQSFTDEALTTCEACGGPLRKVFGNVGIAFKGSGFYKNDSRGKTSSRAGGSDKAAESSSSSSGDSSTTNGSSSDGASTSTSNGSSSSAPAKADTAKASSSAT
jgi:putative FmdB family regulatory protein